MSQSFFEVEQGYAVADHDTGATVHQFLPVSGVPGSGETTLSNAAPLGSTAMDTSTGLFYRKKTAGAGADKWIKLEDKDTTDALQTQIDAFQNGISWREPAKILDSTTYANLTAAEAAVNTGTIDSIGTIAEDDRILFDAITGSNKNVFVVAGTVGVDATLVEDNNLASLNDTLYIDAGTSAGQRVSFNGTEWVVSNLADSDEQGYIRDFIGKGATGVETPVYSSATKVTQNANIEAAVGELDAELDRLAHLTSGIATGARDLDSLLVDDYQFAKWMVVVTDGANRRAIEVSAIHDGDTGDATIVDYTSFAKLKLGTIAGFKVEVTLSGTGVSQAMNLNVITTGSTTATATRLAMA